MTIEEYKPYAKIITDELNVKNFFILIGNTEKGDFGINYNAKNNYVCFSLGGKEIKNKKIDEQMERWLDRFFNKK